MRMARFLKKIAKLKVKKMNKMEYSEEISAMFQ